MSSTKDFDQRRLYIYLRTITIRRTVPVKFDAYEDEENDADRAIDPDSNAYLILEFLASHPETGFTPKEIHDATDISRGSVGTTLSRLEDRGLVRHKEPYWAIEEAGVEAHEGTLVGLQSVEDSTTYEWGSEDPDDHRVGLDTVREDADERD